MVDENAPVKDLMKSLDKCSFLFFAAETISSFSKFTIDKYAFR